MRDVLEDFRSARTARRYRKVSKRLRDPDGIESLITIALASVKPNASPGFPYNKLASSNKELIEDHYDFVFGCIQERLWLLMHSDPSWVRSLSSQELVELGLCDCLKTFIKNEPHLKVKVEEGRYRLIFSVSLVDQCVERILFAPQNGKEIFNWKSIPSCPGMGSTDQDNKFLIETYLDDVKNGNVAETDASGWDWSVNQNDLDADCEMRLVLGNITDPLLKRAFRNRFLCLGFSVIKLSSGALYAQILRGIMKSGSYLTSSSNSRIRALMAKLVGAPWSRAMGDDSIEGTVKGMDDETMKASYLALGKRIKFYISKAREEFGFCGHDYSATGGSLTRSSKALFQLFQQPAENEFLYQFVYEMRDNPDLGKCVILMRLCGWSPPALKFWDGSGFTSTNTAISGKPSNATFDATAFTFPEIVNFREAPAFQRGGDQLDGGKDMVV